MSAENATNRGDMTSGAPSGRPEGGSNPAGLDLPRSFLETNTSTAKRKPTGVGTGLLPVLSDSVSLTSTPLRDADRLLTSVFPKGVDRFFVDGDREKGLDLNHEAFKEVDEYIDSRLESFIINASERNKQLLKEKPYLRSMLINRFNILPEEVTEDRLVQALSDHMVQDKPTPYQDENGVYYLPFNDIQPNDNDKAFKGIRFNWDTEMHLAAVLHSKLDNRLELAKDSLRNAAWLFDVLGYVPNGAKRGLDDTSQPTRHTTMIRMIWDAMSPEERKSVENQQFFNQMWDFAKREYWEVFNAKDPENPFSSKDPLHQSVISGDEIFTVHGSFDVVIYHGVSARGGGWDHSKRCYRREADHSRIDTEMYSYQSEEDFAWWAKQSGEKQEEKLWDARMDKRAARITNPKYYFDPVKGWLFDYDYKHKRKSDVATVTGIFALRLFKDPEQKMRMLNKFEDGFLHEFGVGLTDPETLPKLTEEKKAAINAMETDEGMKTTIKESYNHEQWEGDTQFFNIVKQVCDSLVKAAAKESDPKVKKKILHVIGAVLVNTLVGIVQFHQRSKQESQAEPKQGTIPEKLHTITGEMAVGAQYGDQDELVMGFGAFKEFVAGYREFGNPQEETEHELFVAASATDHQLPAMS